MKTYTLCAKINSGKKNLKINSYAQHESKAEEYQLTPLTITLSIWLKFIMLSTHGRTENTASLLKTQLCMSCEMSLGQSANLYSVTNLTTTTLEEDSLMDIWRGLEE